MHSCSTRNYKSCQSSEIPQWYTEIEAVLNPRFISSSTRAAMCLACQCSRDHCCGGDDGMWQRSNCFSPPNKRDSFLIFSIWLHSKTGLSAHLSLLKKPPKGILIIWLWASQANSYISLFLSHTHTPAQTISNFLSCTHCHSLTCLFLLSDTPYRHSFIVPYLCRH